MSMIQDEDLKIGDLQAYSTTGWGDDNIPDSHQELDITVTADSEDSGEISFDMINCDTKTAPSLIAEITTSTKHPGTSTVTIKYKGFLPDLIVDGMKRLQIMESDDGHRSFHQSEHEFLNPKYNKQQ